MMNSRHAWVVLAPLVLGGCSVLGAGERGATSLEARYSGIYEGKMTGLTGDSAARLVLTVSEKSGAATGVLSNLRSGKSYALSGQFIPVGDGGSLSARLFEGGNRHAADLTATLNVPEGNSGPSLPQITGRVQSVALGQKLLGFDLSLRQVSQVNQAVQMTQMTQMTQVTQEPQMMQRTPGGQAGPGTAAGGPLPSLSPTPAAGR